LFDETQKLLMIWVAHSCLASRDGETSREEASQPAVDFFCGMRWRGGRTRVDSGSARQTGPRRNWLRQTSPRIAADLRAVRSLGSFARSHAQWSGNLGMRMEKVNFAARVPMLQRGQPADPSFTAQPLSPGSDDLAAIQSQTARVLPGKAGFAGRLSGNCF